ncbi:hypothetical protein GRI44_13780 [Altererythrobacter confluentis]|uniref:Uncharacterized protein n=1 Tax=Allopontixanthobacter confluentis TaxID=1849021 RepID=A0A6L7GIS3_9SPHN|nr:hypothetical protein [Allopontixanthobacter confluentis]MXP15819.1 hypothetical protein [Allopontixanthobacter confluentis]
MEEERSRGRKAGALVRKRKAVAFAESMIPAFELARKAGAKTLRGKADWLNQNGYLTINKKRWAPQTIDNVENADRQAREVAEADFDEGKAGLLRRLRMLLPDDHERKSEIDAELQNLKQKRNAEMEAAIALGKAFRRI